jgi:hypothetical protein
MEGTEEGHNMKVKQDPDTNSTSVLLQSCLLLWNLPGMPHDSLLETGGGKAPCPCWLHKTSNAMNQFAR